MSYGRTINKLLNTGNQAPSEANPSAAESLAIDASSYNKLMSEYAQLQQISDTLPNASPQGIRPAAQDALVKAVSDTTAPIAAPGSLVHNAQMILDKLAQKAMQFAANTDMQEPYGPNYNHVEYLRLKAQYENIHKISLTVAESGLSENQFEAACDLIEITLIRYTQFTNTCPELKRQLECYFEHVHAGIEIQALHTIEYLKECQYAYNTMPAPVSRLPFAACKKWITDMTDLLFSGWDINPLYRDALTRTFADPGKRQTVGRLLLLLEKVLQRTGTFRFDKDAALDEISEHIISINPKSLEQAKELLFMDISARLQKESANKAQAIVNLALPYPQASIGTGCPACGMMAFPPPSLYKR